MLNLNNLIMRIILVFKNICLLYFSRFIFKNVFFQLFVNVLFKRLFFFKIKMGFLMLLKYYHFGIYTL